MRELINIKVFMLQIRENIEHKCFFLHGENEVITIVGRNETRIANIHLVQPRSFEFDSQINIYVSDTTNHRIIYFIAQSFWFS